MHGQLNTTFALHEPAQRARVATRRLLDAPLPPHAPHGDVIAFHPSRCVPIVPRRAMRRLRASWACAPGSRRADAFATSCAERIAASHAGKASTPEASATSASAAELVNAGVDFWADFNAELAFACWRAVAALPPGAAMMGATDAAEVARDNLDAAIRTRRSKLQLYLPQERPSDAL